MLNTAAALLYMGHAVKAIASTNEQRPDSICLLLNLQVCSKHISTQINFFGSSRQYIYIYKHRNITICYHMNMIAYMEK